MAQQYLPFANGFAYTLWQRRCVNGKIHICKTFSTEQELYSFLIWKRSDSILRQFTDDIHAGRREGIDDYIGNQDVCGMPPDSMYPAIIATGKGVILTPDSIVGKMRAARNAWRTARKSRLIGRRRRWGYRHRSSIKTQNERSQYQNVVEWCEQYNIYIGDVVRPIRSGKQLPSGWDDPVRGNQTGWKKSSKRKRQWKEK